LSMEQFVN